MSTPNSIREDLVQALGSEYEIERELGRGGASVVYLARDVVLGREVAIKVIRDTHTVDAEAIARFQREARTLASLQHPNIVMLYSAKPLPGGSLALVMQHGNWNTLKTVIRDQGPLPIDAVRQVLHDLGSALVYLHRHQVIHRDIKPENIFIETESGRALLSDFGIAKSGEARTSVTLTGVVIGTPAYMSPEQIDGGELTGRSDLYSLGMVGYEMLTGVRPWDGESLFSVIYKQKTERLPLLAQARPDTPEVLRRVIERATEKAPDARFASAQDFLGELTATEAPRAIPAAVWADPSPEARQTEVPIAGEYPTLEIEQALAEEAFAARERGRVRRQRLVAAVVVALLFSGGAGALAFSSRDLSSESMEPGAEPPAAAEQAAPSSYASALTLATDSLLTDSLAVEADPSVADGETEEAPAEREPAPPRREVARTPPVAQRQTPRAAEPEEEAPAARAPATVAAATPSMAPALSVTRPRTIASNASPVRQLEELPAENVEPPRLRNREQVGQLLAERYPSDLKTRGVEGTTIVTVLVSPSGTVERSSVVTSSGNSRLDQAALAVASRMLFSQPQGVTLQPTWVAVPLTFTPN